MDSQTSMDFQGKEGRSFLRTSIQAGAAVALVDDVHLAVGAAELYRAFTPG